MKKTLLVILAAIASVGVFAQENTNGDLRMANHHRFSIGLRGGTAHSMVKVDPSLAAKNQLGYGGLLDLQYAYYWGAKEGKKVNMGIITGLSCGYNETSWKGSFNDTYSTDEINYAVSGNFNENFTNIVVELPLMFSLQTQGGFFFNVGPRFVLPVSGTNTQILSGTNIDATFIKEGVTLHNEPITGYVGGAKATDVKKGNLTIFNALLATDFGYEWGFKNGHALGLGVYASYGIGILKSAPVEKSMVSCLPQAGGAEVKISSPASLYGSKILGYTDAGLKLVYHFGFPVKK